MELSYLQERQEYLKSEITRLEKELEKYPPGELTIYEYNGYLKWRLIGINEPGVQKHLSKTKDRKKAVSMAQKKLKSMKCDDMKNELKCIEGFLKHRIESGWKNLYAKDSLYRELLVSVNDWEYADYPAKPDKKKKKTVKAPKGQLVRSKSEAIIANCLYENGIPYHYEELHDFDGETIAPDFTIRHPVTGRIYIWEHFGLAEKPRYQRSIAYKLPLYIDSGFIPGINLITTYETDKYHIDIAKISQIISDYFL